MDFYQDALMRGAIIETPDQIERKRRNTMLPRATQRANAGGAVTTTVQPGEENIRRAIELYSQEDDYSSVQDYARQRASQGEGALLNALAAGVAGRRFEPVQAMYLRRAMAAQDPLRVGNAMVSADGTVIKDPSSSRTREADRLMQLGQFERTLADRQEARQDSAALRQMLAGQGRFNHVQDPNTGQVMLYNTVTGEMMPVGGVGGGATMTGAAPIVPGFNIPPGTAPKLTETQDKARFFASNMAQALPGLNALVAGGYMPNRVDQFAAGPPSPGYLGATANALTPRSAASPAGREFYDLGRSVLAAILRKESGAAITDDEWTSYGPIYLPWPGDEPQDVQRKMKVLNNMANNMAMSSGPAYRFWTPFDASSPAAASNDGVIDLTPGAGAPR